MMRQLGWMVTGVVLVLACGSGPEGGQYDPEEQGLPLTDSQQAPTDRTQQAASDYQRPAIDPQRVPSSDEQQLPGVSAQLVIGDYGGDYCDDICAPARRRDCGGGCAQQCEAWRDAPIQCLDVLRRLVECVEAAEGGCEDAVVGCASEFASEISQCPEL